MVVEVVVVVVASQGGVGLGVGGDGRQAMSGQRFRECGRLREWAAVWPSDEVREANVQVSKEEDMCRGGGESMNDATVERGRVIAGFGAGLVGCCY